MTTAARHTRPMSPCINICTMADDGKCMGCRRTVGEIKGWAKLTPDEQWALVEELRDRGTYPSLK